jgi:hypothetical protein
VDKQVYGSPFQPVFYAHTFPDGLLGALSIESAKNWQRRTGKPPVGSKYL